MTPRVSQSYRRDRCLARIVCQGQGCAWCSHLDSNGALESQIKTNFALPWPIEIDPTQPCFASTNLIALPLSLAVGLTRQLCFLACLLNKVSLCDRQDVLV